MSNMTKVSAQADQAECKFKHFFTPKKIYLKKFLNLKWKTMPRSTIQALAAVIIC